MNDNNDNGIGYILEKYKQRFHENTMIDTAPAQRPVEYSKDLGIPARLINDLKNNEVRSNKYINICDQWLATLDYLQTRKWALILGGKVGSGKSFAAAYWLTRSGATAKSWLRVSDILNLKMHDYKEYKRFCTTRRLVLDDLGREFNSPNNATEAALSLLLDIRYDDNLPTLITTNLSLKQIAERYDPRILDRFNDGLPPCYTNDDSLRGAE